jgi:hypothetical protein
MNHPLQQVFFFSGEIPPVVIFLYHQHMEFTFQNTNVILELSPSTVIFWKEVNCWRNSYSNKTTLLLGWNYRYKNSTVIITNWLTYLKWQWIFYFLRRCFLCFITATTFTGLDYEHHDGCLIRSRNCLPFASTWIHSRFWWDPCCSSFQFSMLC